MKNLITLLILILPAAIFSQVTIGKNGAPSSNAVLLEFGNDGDKGVIVPYVLGEPANADYGTIIFDTTPTIMRLKVKTHIGWVDLSGETGEVDLTEQNSLSANPSAKVTIGAPSSNAPGILVLESTNKTFVMPKVYDYTKIVAPSAGMFVYQTKDNMVAFFNGKTWSFWKP